MLAGQTYDTGALLYSVPEYSNTTRYIADGETVTPGTICAFDASGVIALDDAAFDALELAGTEADYTYGFVVDAAPRNDPTTATLVVRHAVIADVALEGFGEANAAAIAVLLEAQGVVVKPAAIPDIA